MITVSEAVRQIIERDQVALEAMRSGILNLSAYATLIKQSVENKTFKSVQNGTISVALYRLTQNITKISDLRPKVKIQNLAVKTSLVLTTYDKTPEIAKQIGKINPAFIGRNDFLTITEGHQEVTIICHQKDIGHVQKYITEKPKYQNSDLIAVSVTFEERYLKIPNVIFVLLGALATNRINLEEIVSTYTEISFVIKRSDLDNAVSALSEFLK